MKKSGETFFVKKMDSYWSNILSDTGIFCTIETHTFYSASKDPPN